jgi:hypothetical protein
MEGSEGGWAENLRNRGLAGRRSLSALGEGRDGGGSRDFGGRGAGDRAAKWVRGGICRPSRPLPFPLVSLLLLPNKCTQNDWK